ncbi:unnamed protein product [Sphagnum balticum]
MAVGGVVENVGSSISEQDVMGPANEKGEHFFLNDVIEDEEAVKDGPLLILKYGKRKTWVVFSLFACSLIIFGISGIATDLNHQGTIIAALFCVVLLMSLEDIATDGLAVKELKDSLLAGSLQAIMQSLGGLLGGIVFIKITGVQLGQWLGLGSPICTP